MSSRLREIIRVRFRHSRGGLWTCAITPQKAVGVRHDDQQVAHDDRTRNLAGSGSAYSGEKIYKRYLVIDTGDQDDRDIQYTTDDMEDGHECKDDARGKDAKYHAALTPRQLDPPEHTQGYCNQDSHCHAVRCQGTCISPGVSYWIPKHHKFAYMRSRKSKSAVPRHKLVFCSGATLGPKHSSKFSARQAQSKRHHNSPRKCR